MSKRTRRRRGHKNKALGFRSLAPATKSSTSTSSGSTPSQSTPSQSTPSTSSSGS